MATSTFGFWGGASAFLPGANTLNGSVFTAPADVGTAVSISVYVKNANAGRYIKGVIVTHSDLKIIANGVGGASAEIAAAYDTRTSAFATPPTLIPGTNYVLMAVCNASATSWLYDDGDANQGHEDGSNDYTTPTDPTDAGHTTKKLCIICTYNVVATRQIRMAQLHVA